MRARFITSAADAAGFPRAGAPEIAVVGRSNVGKSSLINAVVHAQLARTSRTPGRTQTINFFEVDAGFVLADLPGYGYAKAPKDLRREWYALIESYLGGREGLAGVLLLIDARRGAEPDDLEVWEWLRREDRTCIAVATKVDKLPKARKKPALLKIAQALSLALDEICPTSAETGEGIDVLRARILRLTQAKRSAPRRGA
jgi:GTP-binding protein